MHGLKQHVSLNDFFRYYWLFRFAGLEKIWHLSSQSFSAGRKIVHSSNILRNWSTFLIFGEKITSSSTWRSLWVLFSPSMQVCHLFVLLDMSLIFSSSFFLGISGVENSGGNQLVFRGRLQRDANGSEKEGCPRWRQGWRSIRESKQAP